MVLTAPLLLSLMRVFIIFSGQAANHSNQNLQGADHTIKLSWVAVQATKLKGVGTRGARGAQAPLLFNWGGGPGPP